MSAGAASPAASSPARLRMARRVRNAVAMFLMDLRSLLSKARSSWSPIASLSSFDSCPQPVDEALGFLVMGNDRIELRHRCRIWIYGSILQNGFIDQIARRIAIGVGHVIRILRRNIGADQKIDQLERFLRIGRILGDRQIVEP